ncbi:MAG: TIGR04076 family protein [Desulfobacterales bacterium]|nr:MAG: TIGR04076 family protein [Desulfobacterales bacterium]
MSARDKIWAKMKWHIIKRRLKYTDAQMNIFKTNPRNDDVLSKAPELMMKTIIVQVVDSHGCNSQHKLGDSFHFDGAGNLLTKLSPKKICIYALNAITPQIFAANELLFAGIDPNEMRFKRAACFDVGLEYDGWGRIVMEMRVESRNNA